MKELEQRTGAFSPEVLAIYRRLQGTTCKEERGELLLQLASHFADNYDASNEEFPEGFHAAVDSYHQHFLGYNQAALKLGRALLHVLQKHLPLDHGTEGDSLAAPSTAN